MSAERSAATDYDRSMIETHHVPSALVGNAPPRPTGYPRDLWANLSREQANAIRYRMGFEDDDE